MRVIESVRGRLLAIGQDAVSLEVGGVTLRLQVPTGVLAELSPLLDATGAPPTVRLYTHLIIRPDAWLIFGFLAPQERQLFRVLLEIPGIGPRLSLSVLSHLSREEIREAVAARDARRFESVPGIGKRTAARILLELSGKLADAPQEGEAGRSASALDAVEALVTLGLARPEAESLVRAAAREIGTGVEADRLVAAALQRRGRGE
jgi:Holliday junction DNA helicase RuvA